MPSKPKATSRQRGGQPPQCPYIADGLQSLAVPIDKLKPDPGNVRKHNQRNLDSVKYSLEKFGQRTPVVANKAGVILAGNARYEVAKQLGWTHLAVVYVEDDPKMGKLYALADNRTAELAEWDLNLGAVLNELKLDFDVSALWDEAEMANLKMPDISNPPENFPEYDDNIETQYQCPKCKYEWSGKPK